ncbi:hypothetical protein [Streptomyces sp. NPDC047453]|uniref:hypothetical protein n=1 Tax=Streptomyces sp. NPDC047453 TaxID=3154812 RepID=UPI0034020900
MFGDRGEQRAYVVGEEELADGAVQDRGAHQYAGGDLADHGWLSQPDGDPSGDPGQQHGGGESH